MLWACMESEEALWRRDWRPTLETAWKKLHYQLKDRGWGPSCAACRQPLDPRGRQDSRFFPWTFRRGTTCWYLWTPDLQTHKDARVLPDKLVLWCFAMVAMGNKHWHVLFPSLFLSLSLPLVPPSPLPFLFTSHLHFPLFPLFLFSLSVTKLMHIHFVNFKQYERHKLQKNFSDGPVFHLDDSTVAQSQPLEFPAWLCCLLTTWC